MIKVGTEKLEIKERHDSHISLLKKMVGLFNHLLVR